MRTRLITYWEILHSNYWLVPTLMLGVSIILAFGMIRLDELVQLQNNPSTWVYGGGPEGVRTLLSIAAGSMISVATLTFSITIVALSLASSQFGPRLLSNFMRDTGNQVVLGTFIATFMYCLLILRTVRSVESGPFVPHLSVSVGIILIVISLGVLIYFIHHVAISIQADNLIASVGRDLEQAIERLFPNQRRRWRLFEPKLRQKKDLPEDFEQNSYPISSNQSGYVQAVDLKQLMRIATKHDLIVRLGYRPGEFVVKGDALAQAYPQKELNSEIAAKIKDNFLLGPQRLRVQDVEFSINQLVQIALRALSSAINDPITAMACLDQLGVALARLAERTIPPAYRYDRNGNLRLMVDAVTFAGLTDAAFNQIRQSARTNAAVTIRLLEIIAIVMAKTIHPDERAALLRQAHMIRCGSQEAIPEEQDRQDIEDQYQIILKVLEQHHASSL